jgi:hypothetical protein
MITIVSCSSIVIPYQTISLRNGPRGHKDHLAMSCYKNVCAVMHNTDQPKRNYKGTRVLSTSENNEKNNVYNMFLQ